MAAASEDGARAMVVAGSLFLVERSAHGSTTRRSGAIPRDILRVATRDLPAQPVHSILTIRVLALLLVLAALPCAAIRTQVPGFKLSRQLTDRDRRLQVPLLGEVEMTDDAGTQKFFADQVDYDTQTRLMVATGNVVYTSPQTGLPPRNSSSISTRRSAPSTTRAARSLPAATRSTPELFGTQEPDALFYGEVIQKVGPEAIQDHARRLHQLRAADAALGADRRHSVVELDEYAVMKNTVLKVKGVPMFYMPVMYYPIQTDDRATGFLLPTYGSSMIAARASATRSSGRSTAARTPP